MQDDHSGVIAWFVKNPVAANLLMLFIAVAGIISAIQIRKEHFPDLKARAINVSVEYPGATPSEVQDSVVKKIEMAIRGIDGIKRITSVSSQGSGTVYIEAKNKVGIQDLLDKVKSNVDSISSFPPSIERPHINEEIYKSEVLWLSLSGEVSHSLLKTTAETIKDRLASEEGISQINIEGTLIPEISIEVSEEILQKYNLCFSDVLDAVSKATTEIPSGNIKTTNGEIRIKTGTKPRWEKDFLDIPIISKKSGARVPLSSIASISDGFEDSNEFLRIDGRTAVGLQVFRSGDQSTLEISKKVKSFVAEIQEQLPSGLKLEIIMDTSIELKDTLNLLLKNLFMGSILVYVSLAIFLRPSIAMWVMIGIPISFLGTLWLMPFPFIDATVNLVTLFGFMLVLGILVDDAIVVAESVHTEMQTDGCGYNAVIRGAKKVAVPVTFGVLTTIAAFMPLLKIPGASGKMWSGIGFVVILSLLFSLMESKLILPAHLAHIKNNETQKGFFARIRKIANAALKSLISKFYIPFLKISLTYRYASLSLFIVILLIILGCFKGGLIQTVFFNETESNMIQITVKMSPGSSKKMLLDAAEQIEMTGNNINSMIQSDYKLKDGAIKNIITVVTGNHDLQFTAELLASNYRPLSTHQIMNMWRKSIPEIPGMTKIQFSSGFEEAGAPIDIRLSGISLDDLKLAANDVKKELQKYQGVYDIRDNIDEGEPEIRLSLKEGADSLGISDGDIAQQTQQGFYGGEVRRIQRGRDELKVMVRYPESERNTIAILDNMHIRSKEGCAIPLRTVTNVDIGYTPTEIERINWMQVVSVKASVDKEHISPDTLIGGITSSVVPNILSKYPGIKYYLGGEQEEQNETFSGMLKGGVIAVFLIYALMAVPLKSYTQPLVIMSVIPFGIVGAVVGHMMLNMPISILSLLGIIALVGVVVNDSLVFVDSVNVNKKTGLKLTKSIIIAGQQRFRPILLTSLTTFCGLIPILREKGMEAQSVIPMATSLAFGILFSTIITLILIPILLKIGEDISALLSNIRYS